MSKKQPAETTPDAITIYVSPDGDDSYTGRRATVNPRGTDGPLQSPQKALQLARKLRKGKGAKADAFATVHIVLAGGTYFLKRPLTIKPGDSGVPVQFHLHAQDTPSDRPVVFAAAAGQRPVLSGGKTITGFQPTTINGTAAWVAKVPGVKKGKWNFHQLWVNGRRAHRPTLPKKGFFRIAELPGTDLGEGYKTVCKGSKQFVYQNDDIREFDNLQDVEFVALHFWIETRRRLASIDTGKKLVQLEYRSRMRLTDDFGTTGTQYYLENVREALTEPGEFYLDRGEGKLYYVPREGEDIESAEVIAPKLESVLRIEGDADEGKTVKAVHFRGIAFRHCQWENPDPDQPGGASQAANIVPGAVKIHAGHQVKFDGCAVEHVGGYGIELGRGCFDCEIRHTRVADVGAGGIKPWHGSKRTTIADCEVCDGGHRYRTGVGLLIGSSSGNRVVHNRVHDFDYSGISVGWTWGYAESNAYGNIIEYNHVHDIGRGVLSDMGGIYTLGVQPGTRIRYNVFHDITSRGYGGWAIYPDEGSSDILIENNLCYRTNCAGFHQHYGRNNVVRNNIFAYGGEAQIQRTRLEPHNSFFITNNIFYFDNDGTAVIGNWEANNAVVDRNCYFCANGKEMIFAGGTFKQWQQRGLDTHSVVADPKFADPQNGDFALSDDSPAFEVGFQRFDVSAVGPRKPEDVAELAAATDHLPGTVEHNPGFVV